MIGRTADRSRVRGVVVLGVLWAALCGAETDEPSRAPWLEEAAAERGLLFEYVCGHREGRFLFPEIHAGGAALFDADADGDLDAYLVQGGDLAEPPAGRPGNRLFLNQGKGVFRDASEGSGAEDRGYGMGVTAGDYDGDGLTDLYVTNVGPNTLLRNLGGGRFEDVTARAGVGLVGWSASAAFLDYDLDGDLDLFVVRYLNWTVEGEMDCYDAAGRPDYCGPAKYDSPAPDLLYRNLGDGTFEDATEAAGLSVAFGTGLGVATGDFDDDGRPDLFVANDNMLDQLWLGRADGTFVDEAVYRGSAADTSGVPKAGMGIAVADVDDDGDLDAIVCNLAGESDSLFLNRGEYFDDATGPSGLAALSRASTRFGMGWADFDNDGVLDLYQATGKIARQGKIHLASDPYAEPNLLFRGLPGPRYREVEPRGGTAELLVAASRAAAFGDVDGDGGIDVLVVNRDAPAYLLLNRVEERGNWLRLRLLGANGSDALGAVVRGTVAGRRVRRDVTVAYSYQSASEPFVHFGLASTGSVEGLEVRWPTGARECFGSRPANRTVTLRNGAGEPCPEP